MNDQFEDILGQVLAACDVEDDARIDEVLKELLEKEGLDEKEMDFVDETFSLLEASSEEYADLQAAKEEGIGRDEWLARKFDAMLEGRSEEEVKTVMDIVEQATEATVEKKATEEIDEIKADTNHKED